MKPQTYGIAILSEYAALTEPKHVRLIGDIGFGAFFTGWNKNMIEECANQASRSGLLYQSIHAPFG